MRLFAKLMMIALAASLVSFGTALAGQTTPMSDPSRLSMEDPVQGSTNDPAQDECLVGVTAAETGLAEQINALREKKGRSQLNFDQALTLGAEAVSLAQSTEGNGSAHKVRMRTRNQLLQDFATVGAIAMKQKNEAKILTNIKRQSYSRSIILRKPFEHIGVSVEKFDGKTFAVIFLGSEALTPLSC